MSDSTTLKKIERLIAPIVSDLHLDLYDLEFRGGTLRVTLDRQEGTEGGLDLEAIALASRLIGRELDHDDPMSGHYTLEVETARGKGDRATLIIRSVRKARPT